jgi:hypothetical protein
VSLLTGTNIVGRVSPAASLGGTVSSGAMIINDWEITIEPIAGGHRLTARRGTEVQMMDVMDGVGGSGGGGAGLPLVSALDDGKVLTVSRGVWTAQPLPVYEGTYVVTPITDSITLETSQKYMESDVVVEKIPYGEVSNSAGGVTASIG